MPTIHLSQEVDYVTIINYFSVAREDQQKFADSLSDQLTEIVELADGIETLPYEVLGYQR